MIEVFVESIRVNMANYKRVVMLKDKQEGRFLPIWIGHFEADAIAIPLQNVQVSRPLTHDLLKSVVSALGARVVSVVINDLADETFFAKLVLDAEGRHLEIDSRPSDAIALAVRTGVPIYVSEAVLDQAGVKMDAEAEEAEDELHQAEGEVAEEKGPGPDDERLSIFRQFIETLDMDDLDKGKGKEGPSEPK